MTSQITRLSSPLGKHREPSYGNVVELNTDRTVVDSVGESLLAEIVEDALDLLDTSAAVYEKNGDYAGGIFASGWCRLMDTASRKLCNTDDNREALQCGKWHCHESCWKSAKASMETGQPADIQCLGGIRIFAVPIMADGKSVGSIDMGYGNPPSDAETLQVLAERYGCTVEELLEQSEMYQERSPEMIDIAKSRLQTAAKLIGTIVELKQTQRKNQALHRGVLTSSVDPMISIDSHGVIHSVSDSVERVFGWTPGEITGQNITTLIPEPDRSRHEMSLANYMKTGQTEILGQTRELEALRKDGALFPCEVTVSRTDVPEDSDLLFTGIIRDISERKRAETEREATAKRLQDILDSMLVFVGLYSPDGTLIEANRAPLEAAGLQREDVIGKPFWDTYWWSYSTEVQEQLKDALRRAAAGETVRYDVPVRVGEEEFITIDVTFGPLYDSEGCVVQLVGSAVDITERKEAEERVRQLQDELAYMGRLSTMGEMGAGLAHELNQPLAAITTYLFSCQHALDDIASPHAERLRELFDEVTKQAIRAGDIVRRMRSFVQKTIPDRTPIDSIRLIDEVIALMESEIRLNEVDLQRNLDGSLPLMLADRVQIQQVLVNLIRNAIEAMGETENKDRKLVLATSAPRPDQVQIAVSDSGKGIPDENKHKVFEAFFSTKQEGMGMGLAISRSIIESHCGRLDVTPNSDRGVTFHVTLPIATDVEPTVFVVDNDPAI